MDYLESNECSNDKCECKEPFQSQVYYPKNLAEVDGVDLSVKWVELGHAKPTVVGELLLCHVRDHEICIVRVGLSQPPHSSHPRHVSFTFVARPMPWNRGTTGILRFVPVAVMYQADELEIKSLPVVAVLMLGFWEVRVRKGLLYSVWPDWYLWWRNFSPMVLV